MVVSSVIELALYHYRLTLPFFRYVFGLDPFLEQDDAL